MLRMVVLAATLFGVQVFGGPIHGYHNKSYGPIQPFWIVNYHPTLRPPVVVPPIWINAYTVRPTTAVPAPIPDTTITRIPTKPSPKPKKAQTYGVELSDLNTKHVKKSLSATDSAEFNSPQPVALDIETTTAMDRRIVMFPPFKSNPWDQHYY